MKTLDKTIHKYLDLVIFSFGILKKDHKTPGSVHWLKKYIYPSHYHTNRFSLTKIFCVSTINLALCLKAIIWTRDWTSPIPVKFPHTTPEQNQTWITKMDS